jgi:hypothetical protein
VGGGGGHLGIQPKAMLGKHSTMGSHSQSQELGFSLKAGTAGQVNRDSPTTSCLVCSLTWACFSLQEGCAFTCAAPSGKYKCSGHCTLFQEQIKMTAHLM